MPQNYKIKGSAAAPSFKILPLKEAKINKQDGTLYIEGYANTKNMADRYGDIPCVLKAKRGYVYDVDQFKKNPVLLIDHTNKVDHIAGSITDIYEDERGLYFKAAFSSSTHPVVAHARQVYAEGHARGISIAGRFHYEDDANPNHLTLAEIFEISLVAIPADPNGLAQVLEEAVKQINQTAQACQTHTATQEIAAWIEQLQQS